MQGKAQDTADSSRPYKERRRTTAFLPRVMFVYNLTEKHHHPALHRTSIAIFPPSLFNISSTYTTSVQLPP